MANVVDLLCYFSSVLVVTTDVLLISISHRQYLASPGGMNRTGVASINDLHKIVSWTICMLIGARLGLAEQTSESYARKSGLIRKH